MKRLFAGFMALIFTSSSAFAVNYSKYTAGCGAQISDLCSYEYVQEEDSTAVQKVGVMRTLFSFEDLQMEMPQAYPIGAEILRNRKFKYGPQINDMSGAATYDLPRIKELVVAQMAEQISSNIRLALNKKNIEVKGEITYVLYASERDSVEEFDINLHYTGVTKKGTPFYVPVGIYGTLQSVVVNPIKPEIQYDEEGNVIENKLADLKSYEVVVLSLVAGRYYGVYNKNTKKDFADGEVDLGYRFSVITKEL